LTHAFISLAPWPHKDGCNERIKIHIKGEIFT